MIVTCPACATRYLVDPAALRATGRTVRCARCGETWHQDPPRDRPPEPLGPVGPNEPVTPPAMVGGGTPSEARVTFDRVTDMPMERFRTQLPALPRKRRRFGTVQLGWAALAVFVVAGLTALGVFRTELIAAWPPIARLYDVVGLAPAPEPFPFNIHGYKTAYMVVEGKQYLIATGEVVNISNASKDAPDLRLTLRGQDGKLLASADFPVTHPHLAPRETSPFKYSLADPPPDATTAKVTFAVK